MRKTFLSPFPLLAVAMLLSACGSSNGTTAETTEATPAASEASSTASSSAEGTVKEASNSTVGSTVLVDSRGMTLYHLSGESAGKFICTSKACEQAWHPLTVSEGTTPSGSSSLGTVNRPDGTLQVTYKGEPLYTFVQDTKAGQANGQGIKDVGTWSAVATSATAAESTSGAESEPAPPQESSSSSGGGGGYAY
jgi:predicted lipoprotein with Yx(FWY)xxD motif